MYGSQRTNCTDIFESTYNPTSTSLDGPLARFKIQPEHKAIASLISNRPNDLISLLAISQEYGVRPPVLHDNFKLNQSALTLARKFVNCLDNIRIYVEYPFHIDETKKNYIFYTTHSKDECLVTSVEYFDFELDKFIKVNNLPDIKNGKYDISLKFKEMIEKLKSV